MKKIHCAVACLISSIVSLTTVACDTKSTLVQTQGEQQTEQTDASREKFVILLVAGQSNAVGYDESPVTEEDIARESADIFQLGFNGTDNLKVIPLGHCAQSFQNLSTKEFTNGSNVKDPFGEFGPKTIHLPLASLILKDGGIIPEGYKILVIPAAYGNTGFSAADGSYDFVNKIPSYVASGGWRTSGAQYLAMRDRLVYALELNPDNKYLGCVWIQGEADAANPDNHYQCFKNMVNEFNLFFAKYNSRCLDGKGFTNDIWWNVRSTCFWTGDFSDTRGVINNNKFQNASGYKTILENYKEWNPKTFVDFESDEKDTNFITEGIPGTSRVSSIYCSHFGNGSYASKVAPAVFSKIKSHYQ